MRKKESWKQRAWMGKNQSHFKNSKPIKYDDKNFLYYYFTQRQHHF